MIGLLVVTHGNLGKSLLESIAIITGEVKYAESIGLYHGDSPEVFRGRIQEMIEKLDSGKGVLVLVDFFGGTPGNEVLKLLPREKMKVLSGVNMAMLLEVVVNRDFSNDVEQIGRIALESGSRSVMDLNKAYNNMIERTGK
ncbi:PTS sugar transporter subunit IIA [Enterococcus sp. BWB1-3]|uniref:PTS sugar transporter subunit IIA n=1 Tax=unclassified Enterococcus TaxID=2608891 RepID=UPI00192108D7|nr:MULTISPECIES: PTS sugar transporter subunit IIA [unclassified Enterococcus]MBL1229681.1 PTS sugar transporter subunit IIA [Enterococcus sp. BWB1-3]MCB5952815.1 PTS sugar transporter subunit IIA [Enterococcus sp. BWT-B8]MCB5953820.1 PTS sugar transporter subunit IIA [Enterococcus sp. CWB-B31]